MYISCGAILPSPSLELHLRQRLLCFRWFIVLTLLYPCHGGEEAAEDGPSVGIDGTYGIVVTLPFHGDPVLRPLETVLELQERLVRL